jgi:hypothetical protein
LGYRPRAHNHQRRSGRNRWQYRRDAQVFVGGIASPSIAYWGRSPGSVGLDQIVFTVPQGVPLGCNVSIVVETTNGTTPIVSNGPTIAIEATDGAMCSDTTQNIPTSFLSKATATAIAVNLKQNVSTSVNSSSTTTTTTTQAQADALRFSQAQLTSQFQTLNSEPTFGSCLTMTSVPNSNNGAPVATPLNAGTGGADIGPLTFNFTVPQPVTWTNASSIFSGPAIDRTQPLTITWTGGDATGYVDIVGQAVTGPISAPTYVVFFDCAAPASAGQFIIPPSILLSMPTGANAFASLQVSTNALPIVPGTIAGIDAALNLTSFQTVGPVIFK